MELLEFWWDFILILGACFIASILIKIFIFEFIVRWKTRIFYDTFKKEYLKDPFIIYTRTIIVEQKSPDQNTNSIEKN